MLIHISTKATIKQGTIMIGDQYSFAGLAATSLKLKNNIYFARNYIRIGVFFFLQFGLIQKMIAIIINPIEVSTQQNVIIKSSTVVAKKKNLIGKISSSTWKEII
jgi:hypothetical protein